MSDAELAALEESVALACASGTRECVSRANALFAEVKRLRYLERAMWSPLIEAVGLTSGDRVPAAIESAGVVALARIAEDQARASRVPIGRLSQAVGLYGPVTLATVCDVAAGRIEAANVARAAEEGRPLGAVTPPFPADWRQAAPTLAQLAAHRGPWWRWTMPRPTADTLTRGDDGDRSERLLWSAVDRRWYTAARWDVLDGEEWRAGALVCPCELDGTLVWWPK